MNTFKVVGKFRVALFTLAAGAVVIISASQVRSQAQTTKTEKRSRTTWEWSDDGWRRRVEIQGKAEFNEDYSDISGLSADGSVRIEEDHGDRRRLEVRRDASGQLVRSYFVNGESRVLDE